MKEGVNMASQCSLSTLFSIQSQLECALDEAATHTEKEQLVYDYLEKSDGREDLKISDFHTGLLILKLSFLIKSALPEFDKSLKHCSLQLTIILFVNKLLQL